MWKERKWGRKWGKGKHFLLLDRRENGRERTIGKENSGSLASFSYFPPKFSLPIWEDFVSSKFVFPLSALGWAHPFSPLLLILFTNKLPSSSDILSIHSVPELHISLPPSVSSYCSSLFILMHLFLPEKWVYLDSSSFYSLSLISCSFWDCFFFLCLADILIYLFNFSYLVWN